MTDQITTWLNGPRDYDTGAELYRKYGTNTALKRAFAEPPSEFKRKMLLDALRGLKSAQPAAPKAPAAIAAEPSPQKKHEYQWPDQLDDTLAALKARWKPIFAEMMNLTARLYDVALAGQHDAAKKQEAGQMAHRILDLDDQCDEIYATRAHYLAHKRLPDAPAPMELVVDPKKIPLALQNAKRYIREFRAKLARDPGNVKAAETLKKWEWAAGEYEKQLNLN